MTTNRIGPSSAGHVGLRHQRGPGDDAGEARERRAGAEHQHEHARHVVAEHRDRFGMGQRGLNDEADARARQHREQRREHRDRRQQHEHAIGGIGRVEQAKGDEIERGRHAIVDGQLAPDHLHHFLDHEGEAEGEQQFRDMAEPVHSPQSEALDERAERADEQRRDDEPRPETDVPRDFEAEISAEHIKAGMGEVQNAHHAEDQRQAARHHEQQHAVQHAVQGREGYELEHFDSAPGTSETSAVIASKAKRSRRRVSNAAQSGLLRCRSQ